MTPSAVRLIEPGAGKNLLVLGTTQHIKLTGADTSQAYSLLEEIGPPGSEVPSHVHACEDETYFVLEGTYEFTIGGKTVLAGPGTTLFAPRGVPHSMKVVGRETARVLTVVSPPGLEAMFEELSRLPEDASDDAVAAVCRRYGVEFV